MIVINLLEARCTSCDRPFSFVDEFTPDGDGVRHVRCEPVGYVDEEDE